MNPAYRFPGITKFIGDLAGGVHPNLLNKIGSLWFIARARDALSQMTDAPVHARPELLRVAVENRDALALSLRVLDAAIEEVRENCIPATEPDAEPDESDKLELSHATTSEPSSNTPSSPEPARRKGRAV